MSQVISCHEEIVGRTASYVKGSEETGQGQKRRKRAVPMDLTLEVGSHKIPVECHRVIVSFHSEMLNAMLNGNMAEQSEDQVCLSLEGLLCEHEEGAETFKIWLKSIYSGRLELNETTAVKMVNLLSFLMAPALLEHCYEYLINNVNDETVFSFLECSCHYDGKTNLKCDELKKKCDGYLSLNFIELAESDRIQDLSKSTFIDVILKRDEIDCPEITLFKAVLKWSNLKKDGYEMRELLAHIRFPTISYEGLTNVVYPTKLVPDDVLLEAFRYQTVLKDPVDAQKMSDGTARFVCRRIPVLLGSVELLGFDIQTQCNGIYDRSGIVMRRPSFQHRNGTDKYLWCHNERGWLVSNKSSFGTDRRWVNLAKRASKVHSLLLGSHRYWNQWDVGSHSWRQCTACLEKATPMLISQSDQGDDSAESSDV